MRAKPAPTFQAHPFPFPGQPEGPEHMRPDCKLTLPGASLLCHTHAHVRGYTHAWTQTHVLPQYLSSLSGDLSPSQTFAEESPNCETETMNTVTDTTMQTIRTKGHGGTAFLPPYIKAISAFLALEACPAVCVDISVSWLLSCYQPQGYFLWSLPLLTERRRALLNTGSWIVITKTLRKNFRSFVYSFVHSFSPRSLRVNHLPGTSLNI